MDFTGRHCAACGGLSTGTIDADRCEECGRGPLGSRANPQCGWPVRLFESPDPGDCDNCGWRAHDTALDAGLLAANGPCPDCGGPRHSQERRCIRCSLRRMATQHKEMRERSGPHYELAKQRTRLMNDAWRAAGRPRKLQRVREVEQTDTSWSSDVRWYLHSPFKRGEHVPATAQQVAAWEEWERESRRLRRELGWDR